MARLFFISGSGRLCQLFALAIAVCSVNRDCQAQQRADREFRPRPFEALHQKGAGPTVAIDQAHNNFHTLSGRYSPFARVLQLDGYKVTTSPQLFAAKSLEGVDLLVIANALAKENTSSWKLPVSSAFTVDEIDQLVGWIEQGGRLLLIADHMPFPGAARELGKRLGIDSWSNGFAGVPKGKAGQVTPGPLRIEPQAGLNLAPMSLRSPFREKEIKWVVSFTGSAFQGNELWKPVMTLPKNTVSLEPREAWKFDNGTKAVPVGGFMQGGIRTLGKGRVAAFGEAAMFTAQTSGSGRGFGLNSESSPHNQAFLRQVVAWLTDAVPK